PYGIFHEPPYIERYVRWCERSGASRPLLLDFDKPVLLLLPTLKNKRSRYPEALAADCGFI
ncbi:hypothetical protein BSK66_32085, partial [Paenibacillus odorifer]|uniref:hypothetical protein n=1 Tax=Paenibacillus odorifer TaxID=189426 RepID=UPI00097AED93